MPTPETILLVMPESNTTLEPELAALLPAYPRQLVARVPRPDQPISAETLPAYTRSTLAAAAPFIPQRPSLVIYGCTAAGFLAGATGAQAISQGLSTQFGAPVISAADAMVQALRETHAKRVTVLTPYLAPVNAGLRRYLEAAGIEVAALDSLECPDIASLCATTEHQVLQRALAMPATPSDALFIACTQLPTRAILPTLRQRLGIPVWSSISATAWAAARHHTAQAA